MQEGVKVVVAEAGLVLAVEDAYQFEQAVASTAAVEIGRVQEEMRDSGAVARWGDVGEGQTTLAEAGIVQVVA